MAEIKIGNVYKVEISEYERGWGSKIDEVKYFDSESSTLQFVNQYNSGNTESSAPDWYMVAQYWTAINRTMLSFSKVMNELWSIEKQAAVESIAAAKNEALTFLAKEREKIMRMSHDEALKELIKVHKIESKIVTINSVSNSGILSIQ